MTLLILSRHDQRCVTPAGTDREVRQVRKGSGSGTEERVAARRGRPDD